MKRKRPFYHVTSLADAKSILRRGLKGGRSPRNRGNVLLEKPSIFVLTTGNDDATDSIAINQIWVNEDIYEYAIIEIDAAGVTGKVVADIVGEFSANLHRIIEQDLIEPTFLKLKTVRQLGFPGRKLLKLTDSLAKRKWSDEEWALAKLWCDEITLTIQGDFESGKLKQYK